MPRFKLLKHALPVVALLSTTALFSTSASAHWTAAWQSSDGSVTLYHDDYDDAKHPFAVVYEKDGKFSVSFSPSVIDAILQKMEAGTNPSPDDPNNGKGTFKPDVESLIKSGRGAHWTVKVNPEDSPLGGVIDKNGGGKVPHWNPGDDDGKGAPSDPRNDAPGSAAIAKRDAAIDKAIQDAARQATNAGKGMFDGSEGGNEGPPVLNIHGSTGGGSNGGKNQGDRGDGTVTGDNYRDPNAPKGEALGPKPELVNPTPDLKILGQEKHKLGNADAAIRSKDGDTHGLTFNGKDGVHPDLMRKGGKGTNGPGATHGLTFNGKGMPTDQKTGAGDGTKTARAALDACNPGGKCGSQASNIMSNGLLDGDTHGLTFNGASAVGGGHGLRGR